MILRGDGKACTDADPSEVLPSLRRGPQAKDLAVKRLDTGAEGTAKKEKVLDRGHWASMRVPYAGPPGTVLWRRWQ